MLPLERAPRLTPADACGVQYSSTIHNRFQILHFELDFGKKERLRHKN